MAAVKIDLESLKGQIKKIEKKQVENNLEISFEEKKFFSIKDVPKIELSDDEEINIFLTQEYVNFLNLGSFSALGFGKLFEKVAEKLQEIDGEITYCKFLELIGTNRMTALRYRRRYKLYEAVKGENKKLVLTLRDDLIAKLYATKDFLGVAGYIEDGATKEDLEDFVLETKTKLESEKDSNFPKIFDFNYFKTSIFNEKFESKIEKLNKEKKAEVERYFKKIESILGDD